VYGLTVLSSPNKDYRLSVGGNHDRHIGRLSQQINHSDLRLLKLSILPFVSLHDSIRCKLTVHSDRFPDILDSISIVDQLRSMIFPTNYDDYRPYSMRKLPLRKMDEQYIRCALMLALLHI
jgi:hypothetical protein